jgi:competence protein ComEA
VVVLNHADVGELMRLPGIGRRRAEAIIELRTRLGGFERPSDLLRVRGIGTRSLERLLPLIVLDEPPAPHEVPGPRAN